MPYTLIVAHDATLFIFQIRGAESTPNRRRTRREKHGERVKIKVSSIVLDLPIATDWVQPPISPREKSAETTMQRLHAQVQESDAAMKEQSPERSDMWARGETEPTVAAAGKSTRTR